MMVRSKRGVVVNCPRCQKPVAKEDRRGGIPIVQALGQSQLEKHVAGEAPRIKCAYCGMVVVLLRGSYP